MSMVTVVNNGAGWPFMTAGVVLFSAAWLMPYVWRDWRSAPNLWAALDDTIFRMKLGFVFVCLAVGGFALTGYVRSLIIEAHQFDALDTFTYWARSYVQPPMALMLCIGTSMILWDGYKAKAGGWACIAMVLFSIVLWCIGTVAGTAIIDYWWGAT